MRNTQGFPPDPFFWQFEKFGTGEGLLCVPCSKRLPVVRGTFSGALGVKNRRFRYKRDIRYRKPHPTVRGCIFRAPYLSDLG